jgi:hypothetical protein
VPARDSEALKIQPPNVYEPFFGRNDTDRLCEKANPLIKDFTRNGESSMDSPRILILTRLLFVFLTESLIFINKKPAFERVVSFNASASFAAAFFRLV